VVKPFGLRYNGQRQLIFAHQGAFMAEWEVNLKRVTVKMSDGSVFSGEVNIRSYQRLSDFFRGVTDQFVLLVSEEGQSRRVLMLNKNYLIWAEAMD
jgi:hypothetical protein